MITGAPFKLLAQRIPIPKGVSALTLEKRFRKRLADVNIYSRRPFNFAKILEWAREWYGHELFRDLPYPNKTAAIAIASQLQIKTKTSTIGLPGDLAGCHAKIIAQHEEMEQLRARLAEKDDIIRQQNSTIKAWKPIVEKEAKRKADRVRNGGKRYP